MLLIFTNKHLANLVPAAFFGLFVICCSPKTATQYPATTVTPDTSLKYINPVFNHDFPDPNLVETKEGIFYAYSTQANWEKDNFGGSYFLPIIRSKNLVDWQVVGDAFLKKPDWKSEGGIWAPDASFRNNTYFLYYSYSTWGDPNPGIGVATSSKPEGPFTDHGKLFFSKEIGVDNSIDPFFFEDGGKPYLIWGSFHGIYGIELTPDGLKVKGEKFKIAGDSYEGSLIYKKDDFYYYFGSTGTCCDGDSTYSVKVSRSKTFKGPYTDREGKGLLDNGGTLFLEKNPDTTGFIAPGHNGDIVTDKAQQTWLLYHAFNKRKPTGRVMLLDKIEWKDDWPVIDKVQPGFVSHDGPVF